MITHTKLEGEVGACLREVLPNLLSLDLGVVDSHVSALSEEVTDERDGGRFTSVTGVSLESKAENGDVLYCNKRTVSI